MQGAHPAVVFVEDGAGDGLFVGVHQDDARAIGADIELVALRIIGERADALGADPVVLREAPYRPARARVQIVETVRVGPDPQHAATVPGEGHHGIAAQRGVFLAVIVQGAIIQLAIQPSAVRTHPELFVVGENGHHAGSVVGGHAGPGKAEIGKTEHRLGRDEDAGLVESEPDIALIVLEQDVGLAVRDIHPQTGQVARADLFRLRVEKQQAALLVAEQEVPRVLGQGLCVEKKGGRGGLLRAPAAGLAQEPAVRFVNQQPFGG